MLIYPIRENYFAETILRCHNQYGGQATTKNEAQWRADTLFTLASDSLMIEHLGFPFRERGNEASLEERKLNR